MDTESALQQMLVPFIGTKQVSSDTALVHDLSIAGDDAWELLEKVNERFGTDFSKMAFSSYFPNEAEALVLHWARLVGYRSHKKPLTIRHLSEVIDRGVWFEPSATG